MNELMLVSNKEIMTRLYETASEAKVMVRAADDINDFCAAGELILRYAVMVALTPPELQAEFMNTFPMTPTLHTIFALYIVAGERVAQNAHALSGRGA